MKNNIKRLIVWFFILFTVSLGSVVVAEDVHTNAVQQPKPVVSVQTRKPMSRKALAMKFIIAMLGVAASSIVIYVMLTIYNRFIYGSPTQRADRTLDDDFKTPNNLKDALDVFLKKTK